MTARDLTSLLILSLFGCDSQLDCGPNRLELNGTCVPVQGADTGTLIETADSATTDSGTMNNGINQDQQGGVVDTLLTAMPLCINEFVVNNDRSLDVDGESPDWIELHNPTATDVSLEGWTVSDDLEEPDKFVLSHDLVVPAYGFLLLYADGDDSLGAEHLDFKLNVSGETLILTSPNGRQSRIIYPELEEDIAAIRSTDCCLSTSCWTYDWFGTPGISNVEPLPPEEVEEVLLETGSDWAYYDVGSNPGPGWIASMFDDSGWDVGPAPLGYGDIHIVTPVDYGPDKKNKYTTTYFRTTFDVADKASIDEFKIDLMRDDGAVIYLNGTEVVRSNMPEGNILYYTAAGYGVAEPEETAYFEYRLGADLLLDGENQLAAEVHQADSWSSDITLDLGVVAISLVDPEPEIWAPPLRPPLVVENLPPYEPLLPRPCAPIYDQEILPEFSITVDPIEWDRMMYEYGNYGYGLGGELKPYHPLDAFEYEGETINNAEIRLKGNPCCSWVAGEKLQFTIRFDGIDDEARFQGLRHVALDGPYYDPSVLRERLSHSFFRDDMKLPGTCANNARLVVNGEFYGLYSNIEFLDEELLERNFGNGGPDEGYLYKYDYTEGKWECKEGGEENDLSAYYALYDMTDVPSIYKHFDIETFLRHVAADATTPLGDNYFFGSINFAWYRHPDRGWMLMPWDHDYAYYNSSLDPYGHGMWGDFQSHLAVLLNHPPSNNLYTEALLEAYEAYDPDLLLERLDTWSAQIRDSVDEDPYNSVAEFEAEVAYIRSFVYQRKAYLDNYWK